MYRQAIQKAINSSLKAMTLSMSSNSSLAATPSSSSSFLLFSTITAARISNHNNKNSFISSVFHDNVSVNTTTTTSATATADSKHAFLGLRSFAEGAGSYLSESEVTERVLNVIQKFDKVDAGKLSPTAHFKQDLGLDSLDETEVVMAFEEEFSVDIPDAEADKIKSVKDAINFITAEPNAK